MSARAKPAPILEAHGVHASMRAYTRENFSLHALTIKTLTRVYAPVHPVHSVRCAGSRRALTCALARLPRALSRFSIVQKANMAEQTKKPSFSAAFPGAADIIGDFRKAFGPGVMHTYAEESGRTVGAEFDETRYTVIAGKDLILELPKKEESRDR